MTAFASDGKALPDPLTPPDCDLQDFSFMPLQVARLRDSDLAAECEPEACWYAVLLWAASWHQVPAASLPNNDAVLARLVGLGRDLKTWKRHKAQALRGFVLCSDGRLYHTVVAEQALDAWEGKRRQRWQTECARIKKANQRNGTDIPTPTYEEFILGAVSPRWEPPCPENVPGDISKCPSGNGIQETETETETETGILSSGAESAQVRAENPSDKSTLMARCLAVAGPGLADPARYGSLHTSAGRIAAWLRYGADLELDVLPVIAQRTANARASPIRDWSYFDQPVADALARRRAPMPAGDPNAASQGLATPGQDHPAVAGYQPPNRNRRGSGSLTAAALRARARREADRAAGATGLDG